MRTPTAVLASAIAFLLSVTPVQAGTFHYGQRQIEEAGVGCVDGLISAHGNTAYFCGNTTRLNEHMASLAKDSKRYQSIKIVLHAGTKLVDPAEEIPQTGFNNQRVRDQQIPIDWSVLKVCSFDKVAAGICKHDEKSVTVNVWIGATIRLDDLNIPSEFTVQSAGEFEGFTKRHADAK